jgi:hypothetical protein
MDMAALSNTTPVTGTFAAATVTTHTAALTPLAVSLAVTVIVAVPADSAVTVALGPLPLTAATLGALLAQVTPWLVAFNGWIVAAKLPAAPPTVRDIVAGFRKTPVTGCVTVTTHVAVFVPLVVSLAVTVMVAVPGEMAMTLAPRPPLDTLATPGALLTHVTPWLLASEGWMVAASVPAAPPTLRDMLAGFRATPVMGCMTVTTHVAVLPPSSVVTVMEAVPAETAITVAPRPLPATLATAGALLIHITP